MGARCPYYDQRLGLMGRKYRVKETLQYLVFRRNVGTTKCMRMTQFLCIFFTSLGVALALMDHESGGGVVKAATTHWAVWIISGGILWLFAVLAGTTMGGMRQELLTITKTGGVGTATLTEQAGHSNWTLRIGCKIRQTVHTVPAGARASVGHSTGRKITAYAVYLPVDDSGELRLWSGNKQQVTLVERKINAFLHPDDGPGVEYGPELAYRVFDGEGERGKVELDEGQQKAAERAPIMELTRVTPAEMKVAELREALSARGLSAEGRVRTLRKRLVQAAATEDAATAAWARRATLPAERQHEDEALSAAGRKRGKGAPAPFVRAHSSPDTLWAAVGLKSGGQAAHEQLPRELRGQTDWQEYTRQHIDPSQAPIEGADRVAAAAALAQLARLEIGTNTAADPDNAALLKSREVAFEAALAAAADQLSELATKAEVAELLSSLSMRYYDKIAPLWEHEEIVGRGADSDIPPDEPDSFLLVGSPEWMEVQKASKKKDAERLLTEWGPSSTQSNHASPVLGSDELSLPTALRSRTPQRGSRMVAPATRQTKGRLMTGAQTVPLAGTPPRVRPLVPQTLPLHVNSNDGANMRATTPTRKQFGPPKTSL
jgi:hypothetical protein